MATTSAIQRIPKVFDKYMLPKVAFTMVTLASLGGAILTGLRHGWSDWHLLALRWAAYWVLGLLLGTEIWKIGYLRPSVQMRPVPEAVAYGQAMLDLHRRWQRVLAPVGSLLIGLTLIAYATGPRRIAVGMAAAAALALVTALIGLIQHHRTPIDTQRQDAASWLTLAGLAATAAIMGALDVLLQPDPGLLWLLIPNRILHLWAFAAWLGGALWNIFIAVPAGRVRENIDTVILANFQLERFRVVVRAVFPTIVLTGLFQAFAMFFWRWEPLFTTTWGWLALAKIGLILGLVAVFIACPMWGACSPIRGVCDLDDLYNDKEDA